MARQTKAKSSKAKQIKAMRKSKLYNHFIFFFRILSFFRSIHSTGIHICLWPLVVSFLFLQFFVLCNKNVGIFDEPNILSQCCMIIILLFSCYLSTFELEFRNWDRILTFIVGTTTHRKFKQAGSLAGRQTNRKNE